MQLDPRSPEAWLRYARSDLAVAETASDPEILPETLCYHAQQAAEKAVKAVLVRHRVNFPYTHSLAVLMNLLPPGTTPPSEADGIAELSKYAAAARYPGGLEEASREECTEAARVARAAVTWAESLLGGGG
jgi:HEPN domain-containing protein